jgi:hypothetical protein
MQPNNEILSLRHLEGLGATEFIDQIIAYLVARHHSDLAKAAAERAVSWFARKRWGDYCSQDVRARLHGHADTRMLLAPLERISVVTACMDRNAHILESLPSWLAVNRFEEIIIIDYGSSPPLKQALALAGFLDHPNLRLIRVEAENWCMAEAFNTGLLEAKAPFTLKLEADTLIRGMADMSLRLSAQQFRTGNWRTFGNDLLNGLVLAPTGAITTVGGYNEQLRHSGWDETNFYERLSELGLSKADLVEREFCRMAHSGGQSTDNPDGFVKENDTNALIQGNRVLANLLPKWTDKAKRQFSFHSIDAGGKQLLEDIRGFASRISKIQDDYVSSENSAYGYGAMLRDIASQISCESVQTKSLSRAARAPVVLMISLYEDRADTRQREMIRCLRANSQIFDKIIVLYESSASTETALKSSIADELKRLSGVSRFVNYMADIEIILIKERPAYRDFFELSGRRTTDGMRPWFVIANADIAFDRSIERIHELENLNEILVCLSRWDKCPNDGTQDPSEFYFDPEGIRWALIESSINGSQVPNYLSADAWIFKRRPENWEEYTYKLGTYFCDSFFANRAFRSGRPVINPCRSIRCFHYHDQTVNSSAQKFEDKAEIERLYGEEMARLGGENPVAGVQWSTLEICQINQYKTKPYRWNPEGGLWLRLACNANIASILIILEATLKATEATGNDIFVGLVCDHRYSAYLATLFDFIDYLGSPRLFIDLRAGPLDRFVPERHERVPLLIDSPVSYASWGQLAESITAHLVSNPAELFSGCLHAQILRLLAIEELDAVKFLAAHYPEYLQ